MTNDEKVVTALNQLLADATVLYQKLRHYHWNVDGRHFFELHGKFEELYTRWATTIDDIAERILAVDGVPLHTLAAMLAATRLREDESVPAGDEMVETIVADLKMIHTNAGEIIELAEARRDRGTVNLLDAMRDAIDKDVWMLAAWRREPAKRWS